MGLFAWLARSEAYGTEFEELEFEEFEAVPHADMVAIRERSPFEAHWQMGDMRNEEPETGFKDMLRHWPY